jgi:outer membrane protein assembly factor BamA
MSLSEQLSKDAQDDLFRNQTTKPVVLNKIEITGGDFSNDFYNKLVSPALNSQSALSLTELETELISIREKLQYIGLFNDIGIKLDLDEVSQVPTLLKGEPQISENPLPVKAIISLTEMPLFKYASYSKSTDYDVAAGFRYLNPNFSQNGDSLIVDVNINYDPFSKSINRKVWDLSYLSPTWSRSNSGKFVINPTISTIDAQRWASHQQFSAGALIGLQNLCWKKCGATVWTVGLSGSLRQVTDISNNASDLIRTYAGGDLKLGLQTHFSHDSRKYIGRFTSGGSCISLDNEFSGHNSVDYSGSQQCLQLQPFLKSLLKLEGASSFLFDNFTLGYNVQAGFIKSLAEDDELHISDKFFLGGLSSLQGFQSNSVGVKSGNDYVGGLSHFKADFRLFTRLPNSKKESPLRMYNYFNIGDVYDFNTLEQTKSVFSSGVLMKKSAVATGLGLSYKADNATLDLSYNIPLSNRSQDTAKPGLSFAVVLSFK